MNSLQQRLNKIENELEKVRGVEYSLTFGSMRRARVSRKWDELSKEKFKIIDKIKKQCNGSCKCCDGNINCKYP